MESIFFLKIENGNIHHSLNVQMHSSGVVNVFSLKYHEYILQYRNEFSWNIVLALYQAALTK